MTSDEIEIGDIVFNTLAEGTAHPREYGEVVPRLDSGAGPISESAAVIRWHSDKKTTWVLKSNLRLVAKG